MSFVVDLLVLLLLHQQKAPKQNTRPENGLVLVSIDLEYNKHTVAILHESFPNAIGACSMVAFDLARAA